MQLQKLIKFQVTAGYISEQASKDGTTEESRAAKRTITSDVYRVRADL